MTDYTENDGSKPWYRSLASWGGIVQLALTVGIAAALYLGVDVEALLRHGMAAAGIAASVMQILGNVARQQPIDPEQVLPKVRSRSVGRVINGLKRAKAKVMP